MPWGRRGSHSCGDWGDRISVIESAVISGRTRLRLASITFPGRFRFTHIAGQDYRHHIEASLSGVPIMNLHEYYLNGKSPLELPFGVVEDGPRVDQAANLGLCAEAVFTAEEVVYNADAGEYIRVPGP
jgi:hypothetical protein